jgi:carbonic anhydrase
MAQSKVLIISCSDPRLVVWMDKYIRDKKWRPMEVDRIISPGVVPAIAWKMTYPEREVHLHNIKLLYDAHHFGEIVLVTHEDCAAIGGSAAFAGQDFEQQEHKQMLILAQQAIENVLSPDKLKFTLLYVARKDFDLLNNNWGTQVKS